MEEGIDVKNDDVGLEEFLAARDTFISSLDLQGSYLDGVIVGFAAGWVARRTASLSVAPPIPDSMEGK